MKERKKREKEEGRKIGRKITGGGGDLGNPVSRWV